MRKVILLSVFVIFTCIHSSNSSLNASSESTTALVNSPQVSSEISKKNDLSESLFSFRKIKDFLIKGRAVDFARTFSSLRGSIGTPMTALMYMGSLAVGAIVMLAFYESPISPLPVPPLPDPPVGRFPPEHPIWPPRPHTIPRGPSGPNGQASELRPMTAYGLNSPPNLHRRSGYDNSPKLFPLLVSKNTVNSIKPKTPQKSTKLSPDPPTVMDLKLDPIYCNGTSCDSGLNTSSLSTSNVKDKPQKLFDILMPRTSDSVKLGEDELSNK